VSTSARLVRLLRPHGLSLAASLLCMMGVALFTVQLAALIRPLFDRVLLAGEGGEPALRFPILLLLFYLGKGLCAYVATVLTGRVGQQVMSDLRCRAQAASLHWPLARYADRRTGDLLSRVLADVQQLDTAVSEKLGALARESLVLLGLAAWLVYLDPALALGSALAAPLVLLPLSAFGRRVRREGRRAQAHLGDLSACLQEEISGIRAVKAFGMEEYEAGKFARFSRRLVSANLRALRAAALTPPLMELVGGIAAAAVFLYGSGRIADGRMTVGGFTSFLTTLLLMYTPVKKISNAHMVLQHSLASAERVFEVLDLAPEPGLDRPGVAVEAPRQGIRFEDVWFRYRDEWVLQGVDLLLPAGKVVALVGASGAGKSTLANLLLRFHEPDKGRITWDGIDLARTELGDLRRRIALVSQETILFHDTVERNIAYGREDLSPEQIRAAACAANADAFIRSLPEGYREVVGERGERLSAGQRQRLAIARAVVKAAPVLILDEATSSLDVETEAEVQGALDRLMARRTVLLIAHRLSTVRRADRILVLEGGRIVETGDHQDLLRRQGVYARMHRRFAAEPGNP
jgi:subfamily B ATP-binding cassette protein MsbA